MGGQENVLGLGIVAKYVESSEKRVVSYRRYRKEHKHT